MPDSVLVLTAAAGGNLSAADAEAIALGRDLASSFGGLLDCAVTDTGADDASLDAAERGAGRVLRLPPREADDADAAVAAAAVALTVSAPAVVVIARSDRAPELASRLAGRVRGALLMGALGCTVEADGALRVTASAFGGAVQATYRLASGRLRILVPAVKAYPAAQRVPGRTAERIDVNVPASASRVDLIEAAKSSGPRLEDARVVVSGGRGLGKAENFALVDGLANALGGMAGASRAIVDLSWASPAQQVGLTGKIVAPDLYVAAGISGASQHMMGCSNARTIVAINTDANAPIFKYAHYGIVGDAMVVLPELIRLSGSESA